MFGRKKRIVQIQDQLTDVRLGLEYTKWDINEFKDRFTDNNDAHVEFSISIEKLEAKVEHLNQLYNKIIDSKLRYNTNATKLISIDKIRRCLEKEPTDDKSALRRILEDHLETYPEEDDIYDYDTLYDNLLTLVYREYMRLKKRSKDHDSK